MQLAAVDLCQPYTAVTPYSFWKHQSRRHSLLEQPAVRSQLLSGITSCKVSSPFHTASVHIAVLPSPLIGHRSYILWTSHHRSTCFLSFFAAPADRLRSLAKSVLIRRCTLESYRRYSFLSVIKSFTVTLRRLVDSTSDFY